MNKVAYIKELTKRLKYIPGEDREDAIEYYTELMSDMGLDDADDVEKSLGSPKEAAKKILDECTTKHIEEYEDKKTVKGHATVVWLSILGVLSLPLSLPLAVVVLVLAITLIVVFLAILISFAATAFALVVSGLASFVLMWAAPGIAQKVVVLGFGLCSLAVGTLIAFGLVALIRLIFRKIFRKSGTSGHQPESVQNASEGSGSAADEETIAE
ncbi:MAG: DUF1700 domain-containing protein [Lachnospiraceae bacterium]|nr:DUF1700 domain-containing protein [Lachnospiraceae bacterium]